MPKIHFCKYYNEFIQCCETNPEKFEFGRYSICRKCRIIQNSIKRISKNEENKKEKIKETIKDVLDTEDLVEGKSITEFLNDSHKIVSDMAQNSYVYKVRREEINKFFELVCKDIDNLRKTMKELIVENDNHRKRIKFLESDVEKLNEKLNIKNSLSQTNVTILKK